MVLENVAADVIVGPVEGRGAILASAVAHVIDITHKKKKHEEFMSMTASIFQSAVNCDVFPLLCSLTNPIYDIYELWTGDYNCLHRRHIPVVHSFVKRVAPIL